MIPAIARSRRPPAWAALTLAFLVLFEAEMVLTVAIGRGASGPVLRIQPDLIDPGHVAVLTPVTIRFGHTVDTARLGVVVEPASPVSVVRLRDRLVVGPSPEWVPEQRYTITVTPGPGFDRRELPRPWTAGFQTQPRLSVSGFRVGGTPAGQQALAVGGERVEVQFPNPMRPGTVHVMLGGSEVDPSAVAWSADAAAVSVSMPDLAPYQPVDLKIPRGAVAASGDLLTEGGGLQLTPVAVLPSNPSSGIPGDAQHQTPVEIVLDNSPPARPQSGLQSADIVYEYLSEYQVSRMTAIYFGQVPGQVGPVRSCRMVNPYLNFALQALTMCSGGSVGTLHYMFGNPEGGVPVPGTINDFDHGHHFDRVGFRAAPYNVYTSADQINRLRAEWPLAPGAFAVQPPRPDIPAGEPAEAPSVPLHSVSWSYDGAAQVYDRFDHGQPFVDAGVGHQVRAKNLVMLHVPFRDAGWVEDENGGAHSVWYDLLGSGPAEIYSDGRLLNVTWHMGSAPGQWYYDNHTPVWFSDATGHPVQLNSGLTWIHVLGNGQTG